MSIYDGLKDAAGILKEACKIEQYRQILYAQEKMLEMQKKIGDLEKENTDLKDKLKTKGNLRLENHAYWMIDNGDGPFCTRCWDAENKMIRLHPTGNPAFYNCPSCKCGSVRAKPELDRPLPASPYRPTNWR